MVDFFKIYSLYCEKVARANSPQLDSAMIEMEALRKKSKVAKAVEAFRQHGRGTPDSFFIKPTQVSACS